MNTRTAHIARRPWGHDAYSNPMAISLPAEPFTIPPAATDETAPTALPVRSGDLYDQVKMGERTTQLRQYGESQGWKCTIRQAADDIGLSLETARVLSQRAGFRHKFAGHKPRSSKGEYHDNATAGSIRAIRMHGHSADVDVNLIPLDRLIR